VKYKLIHITSGGEYKTPLVASQLFDQAQVQALKHTGVAPATVQAWILCPFRELWDRGALGKVTSLKQRCPDIQIKMIPGIDRLKDFPKMLYAITTRRALGSEPVIYHCRGEFSAPFAIALKKHFPQDKVVLDIRGFWPAELLYRRGIEMPELAKGQDAIEYNDAKQKLRSMIAEVDAVTAVSKELRSYLIKEMQAPETTTVVPCCVKNIPDEDSRGAVRLELGFHDNDIVVVYSGTAASYQHLQDITLPFLCELGNRNKAVKVLILSPDIDEIAMMLTKHSFRQPVVLKNVPQSEVAKYLSAADVGILLRKPTFVNRVANPVKIAEYLASGVSIIAEKGVGGIPQSAFDMGVVVATTLTEDGTMAENLDRIDDWLNTAAYKNRNAARTIAGQHYYWYNTIDIHRASYTRLLSEL
jgi:glycosyltransferase involved in cell wall biosynthesis